VRQWSLPRQERRIPPRSGEAAIYSPEYLARKEGNAIGAEPEDWQYHVI
jgi:hypothetical protein